MALKGKLVAGSGVDSQGQPIDPNQSAPSNAAYFSGEAKGLVAPGFDPAGSTFGLYDPRTALKWSNPYESYTDAQSYWQNQGWMDQINQQAAQQQQLARDAFAASMRMMGQSAAGQGTGMGLYAQQAASGLGGAYGQNLIGIDQWKAQEAINQEKEAKMAYQTEANAFTQANLDYSNSIHSARNDVLSGIGFEGDDQKYGSKLNPAFTQFLDTLEAQILADKLDPGMARDVFLLAVNNWQANNGTPYK